MPQAEQADSKNGGESRQSSSWRQIAIGVTIGILPGIFLGVVGTFYSQGKEIAALKEQINQLKSQGANLNPNQPREQLGEIKAKPERLIEIITEQQRIYIKESYGELANQSFTQRDLDEFKKKDTTKQITDKLRHNGEFLEVVLAIKQMSLGEQQKLYEQASRTYKPTWAEIGETSRKGQTEVGQEAERLIAGAIVGLVRELSKLAPENIKKLSLEK